MPFVTVKPKFQVTIPANLRRGIDLREGDIMEMTLVDAGILFRPKEPVDRGAGPNRIAAKLAATRPSPEDLGPFRGRDHDGLDRRDFHPGT